MNWQEALEEIRSVEFDVNLNVVSSTDRFFEAVAEESAVLSACILMQKSGELQEETLGVLRDLVRMDTDPSYENPNDTPLAVLLWLTNFAAQEHAMLAAIWVDQAPRCWHAKKLAQRILNPPPTETGNPGYWGDTPKATVSSVGRLDREYSWVQVAGQLPRIYGGILTMESSTLVSWENTDEGAMARSVGAS